MTQYAPLIVFLTALLLVLAYWVPHWRMRLHAGEPAPDLREFDGQVGKRGGRRFFYFFGPKCGHCRNVTPYMEALARDGETVIKVDVSRTPELARRFKVRLIPAVIKVENGRLDRILVGPNIQQDLRELVSGRHP